MPYPPPATPRHGPGRGGGPSPTPPTANGRAHHLPARCRVMPPTDHQGDPRRRAAMPTGHHARPMPRGPHGRPGAVACPSPVPAKPRAQNRLATGGHGPASSRAGRRRSARSRDRDP
ncbi:MAG: hypothetical protein AVDCRST_MAG49-2687 [uncultured Thermomicrobiales bacterium]|uniref:Uncharacterized protein n=1 Tax=uncultured Thermomicrobiales bacterium TaxID=1645740 RepID=A0A6J4V0C6_9BACT|nr:MAG: hypothetical protein AVDCRST_MAG49-2687 [uncultured Thermomicrobiales bacterium]